MTIWKVYVVSEVVYAETVFIEVTLWKLFSNIGFCWYFGKFCLSTLLVEVINGEWREARQMSGIPVAFSYFKVLIFSSYIGSHLCNWLSWFIVRRCCLILAKYFAKFPVTKRGVLLAGKADSVNTEVPFHWLPLTILTEWTNRLISFRLEESPPTASTAEFLQVGLSSPYYHPLQTHLSF